jgi:hypothetical protein
MEESFKRLKPTVQGLRLDTLAERRSAFENLRLVRADTTSEPKKVVEFDRKQRKALEDAFKKSSDTELPKA